MRGFWIGIAIGLVSLGIVFGVGLLANFMADRGLGKEMIIAVSILSVVISGIYGAKTL